MNTTPTTRGLTPAQVHAAMALNRHGTVQALIVTAVIVVIVLYAVALLDRILDHD